MRRKIGDNVISFSFFRWGGAASRSFQPSYCRYVQGPVGCKSMRKEKDMHIEGKKIIGRTCCPPALLPTLELELMSRGRMHGKEGAT